MRPGPGTAHVAAGLELSSTVDVWHGGQATVHGVKVAAGSRLVEQIDQEVPERLDVTLPVEWEGISLDPGNSTGAALGSDGHELALTVHLTSLDGLNTWTVPVGRFQVQQWHRVGAGVKAIAHGLLQQVADWKRASPRSPVRGSSIAGELMRELGDVGFTTRLHDGLTSRPVPRDFIFGENRLAAIRELVTAWPARIRVDPDGVIEILPPLTPTLGAPVVHFHDGQGGTLVGAPSEGSREGVFNHVAVKIHSEGDAPTGVHEQYTTRGRLDYRRFNVISRPSPIDSRAITSLAQAQAVAHQELAKAQVRLRTLPVEAAPDWRLQLDDVVRVRTAQGVDETGRLTGIDLPLTSADGVARYNVGVID